MCLQKLPGISPEEPGTPRIKSNYWREHGGEYDILFLGSSRIFRQLDPQFFEEVCAEQELELRAYNWGLPGMRTYESVQRVEQLLRHKSERLKWIVIELLPKAPPLEVDNLYALREIQWHTPYLTSLAMRRVLASQAGFAFKQKQLGYHAYQATARFLNLGAVANAWEQLFDEGPALPEQSKAGFFPLEQDRSASVLERRTEFVTELRLNPDLLLERVRDFKTRQKSQAPDDLLVEQIEYILQITSAAGVEPLFVVVPPVEQLMPQIVGAREAGILPNLFHYADPADYRSFYTKDDLRFDHNHLSLKGVERLTRRFALDFVDHLKAKPGT